MQTKNLGTLGTTSAIGLGLMGMSDMYGPSDRAESIATIHAALDAGVTLLDTGDFYGMGHNEMLLAEALRGRSRDQVQISVKFGGQRGPDGSFLGFDARPAAVKNVTRVFTATPRHRSRRRLPARPTRPGRSDRRHRRRGQRK